MTNNKYQINNLYRRLLYRKNLAPINIKFTKSNTLFDKYIYSLETPNINFIPDTTADNSITSQILFVNNPVEFVQQPRGYDLPTSKVLFFHDDQILSMKKEDLYLFNQQIQGYDKYTFDINISQAFPNIPHISYGFKAPLNLFSKREKSILFISTDFNLDNVIYSHIKSLYPDADQLPQNSLKSNIDFSQVFLNYKICISTSSYYNNLLAASHGCYIVSPKDNIDIPHYKQATNLDQMLYDIKQILDTYDDSYHQLISQTILDKYDHERYSNTIMNIINNTCNKVIKL